MSVNKVTGVSRVELPITALRSSENTVPSNSEQKPSNPIHEFLDAATPRRFPWLSWETRELEAASKQPSPYGNIPLLGKDLDQKV